MFSISRLDIGDVMYVPSGSEYSLRKLTNAIYTTIFDISPEVNVSNMTIHMIYTDARLHRPDSIMVRLDVMYRLFTEIGKYVRHRRPYDQVADVSAMQFIIDNRCSPFEFDSDGGYLEINNVALVEATGIESAISINDMHKLSVFCTCSNERRNSIFGDMGELGLKSIKYTISSKDGEIIAFISTYGELFIVNQAMSSIFDDISFAYVVKQLVELYLAINDVECNTFRNHEFRYNSNIIGSVDDLTQIRLNETTRGILDYMSGYLTSGSDITGEYIERVAEKVRDELFEVIRERCLTKYVNDRTGITSIPTLRNRCVDWYGLVDRSMMLDYMETLKLNRERALADGISIGTAIGDVLAGEGYKYNPELESYQKIVNIEPAHVIVDDRVYDIDYNVSRDCTIFDLNIGVSGIVGLIDESRNSRVSFFTSKSTNHCNVDGSGYGSKFPICIGGDNEDDLDDAIMKRRICNGDYDMFVEKLKQVERTLHIMNSDDGYVAYIDILGMSEEDFDEFMYASTQSDSDILSMKRMCDVVTDNNVMTTPSLRKV